MRQALAGGMLAAFASAGYACIGADPAPSTTIIESQDGSTGSDATSSPDVGDRPPADGAAPTPDASDAGDAGAPPVTRAFVSSMKYFGDSIGSVATADTDCQALATAAGRGTGWKAWLSSTTSNAKDRVVLGADPIKLLDGVTVVVAHGTDLVGDGGLAHAIDHDEHATAVSPTLVWTGTTTSGLVYTGGGANGTCTDWTSASVSGSVGASNQTVATWTSDALEPCTNSYPIYCFAP